MTDESSNESSNKRQKLSGPLIPSEITDERERMDYVELEKSIVAAIFQVGLAQSSPKALIGLMPETPDLTREHIKSHLQKYRIQTDRSREQFLEYFEKYMKQDFYHFLQQHGHDSSEGVSEIESSNLKSSSEPCDGQELLCSDDTSAGKTSSCINPSKLASELKANEDVFNGDREYSPATLPNQLVKEHPVFSTPSTVEDDIARLKAEFDEAHKEAAGIRKSLTDVASQSNKMLHKFQS
mmetsp:Transcript_23165/g.33963  ORF Transcript_23165/g.33963 Transcript_23165/m.33963 type:complete len:239 (-) Transcript_23165:360-1076(-)